MAKFYVTQLDTYSIEADSLEEAKLISFQNERSSNEQLARIVF